ncbi:MAG: NAD(+) synthase [Haliea sp.]|nr:MAG: NAD(+) synthase [Haliea sp.]
MTLKICVAQLNYCVGDMPGNAQKIIAAARTAYADGARLLLTPEMAICGYAAEDLFLRRSFIEACDDAVNLIARELAGLKGLTVVVGTPTHGDSGKALRTKSVEVQQRHNAARVLREGAVIATYAKRELPNYQVFDERRYFTPGQGVCVFEAGEGADAVRIGLLICEDAWFEEPARLAKEAGAELLAVINASPFHVGKGGERELMMCQRVLATGLPMVYAHLVGGQDEIVFEGHSFALQADGVLAGRAESFKENLFVAHAQRAQAAIKLVATIEPERSPEADLWDALVLGVRDYLGKNGFPGAILGLSGGIDSALVLAIAVDALGADKVRTVMMPSPYTADISWIDAREMATGYCTLYGDMAGGFAVIKDLLKTTVFRLAEWRNQNDPYGTGSNPIPERIITRPPSAELRADQTDQDSLPPYEVLDAILRRYMENDESIESILSAGFDPAVVERVTRLIKINEYKRRQAPVGIRVSHRSFGKDWRYPITSKFRQ